MSFSPSGTLYYHPKTCSSVSKALLYHLQIPHTAVLMRREVLRSEAADGTMSHEGYLKINPFGLVPALRVDNNVILETPALLQMIGHLSALGARIPGTSTVEKASVVIWCAWLSGTLHATRLWAVRRPDKFLHSETGEDA